MDHSENTRLIFDKYAEAYQEKYMDVSLYANQLDQFLEMIKNNDAKVLDVGCGPGNITKYLLDKKPDLRITGIDISENMIGLARMNNPNASFKTMDCRNINEIDKKFDAIIAGFFLSYLSKTEVSKFLGNCSELMNTNGVLYISTMKDDYENSGYMASSKNNEERLFTYYHETQYLSEFLNNNGLEIVQSFEIENENNKYLIKDLVLISIKS